VTTFRVVLMGADHTALGESEDEAAGPDAAAAISRGARSKSYEYTDPNEDAVACVAWERSTLLIVVDGHNGYTATPLAMGSLLDSFAGRNEPPAREDFVEAFTDASRAIIAVTRTKGAEHPDSRVAATVALVHDQTLHWAAMGDAPLIVVSDGTARQVAGSKHVFLGWSKERENHEQLESGSAGLEPGAWVIATSDGYIDFAGKSREEACNVTATLASRRSPPKELAMNLLQAAFEGGAGDNVSVAVTRVTAGEPL
jgi:serine/threonine protein phosphatase PrpC